jgi:hypothetical protein
MQAYWANGEFRIRPEGAEEVEAVRQLLEALLILGRDVSYVPGDFLEVVSPGAGLRPNTRAGGPREE